MTKNARLRDRAVVMSSTMPSEKYSCSGSLLRFAKGSTAIDGLSEVAAERFAWSGVSRCVIFANDSDKSHPPSREGLDQPLCLAVVAQLGARSVDTGAQSGIGYDTSTPHLGDQFVPADDMRSALDEIEEEIEDLWLEVDRYRATKQFAAIRIERKVFKKIPHETIPN